MKIVKIVGIVKMETRLSFKRCEFMCDCKLQLRTGAKVCKKYVFVVVGMYVALDGNDCGTK